MSKKIEIGNFKEFNKQRIEDIYKSSKYAELRIVVAHNDTIPVSELNLTRVTEEDIARLICSIKNQLEYINEICPEAFTLAQNMIGNEIYTEEEEEENE